MGKHTLTELEDTGKALEGEAEGQKQGLRDYRDWKHKLEHKKHT